MADTSQLEAELLAALGMSEPVLGNPLPTEANTSLPPPPQPPTSEAPSEPVPTPPPPPSAPAPILPPTPPIPPASVEPLASAPTPIPTPPVPNATPSLPTPNASAPDTLSASESIANGLSSSDLLSQSLAQALSAPRADASPQQPPVATPVPAPQQTLGSHSPKRPRSSDGLDGGSAKRQKTDQTVPKQDIALGGPNLDLAAMLNNALASFDQHTIPGDDDLIMPDADMAQPAAPASPSPELERVENKIMKASSNPFYVMRSMSLPVLGNIAVQILLRLSQQPLAETETLLSDSDSEFCKAYDMLRDIFRATRRAFSDSPLLSPDELDITDSEDRETIRMSNLGATAASVFGAHDVSLLDVHDAFFSIFVPEDGEYRSSLTELLVSLKTRLLLDALNKPEQSQPVSQLLDSLFPVNFDDTLKQRSGDLLLNADEEGLASKIRERREQLVKSAADESIKKSLEDQSSPAKFAESLSIFLQSHLGVVVDYAEKYGVNIPLNEEETATTLDLNNAQHEEHDSLAALLQSATSHLAHTEGPTGDLGQGKDALSNGIIPEQLGSDDDSLDLKKLIEESLSSHVPELKESSADQHLSGLSDFDSKNLASLISEKLKNDLDIPTHGLPNLSTSAHPPNVADSNNVHSQYLAQLNHAHPAPYQPYTQGAAPAAPVGANGELLPPNQSMPTAALYEKARQAAVAKSSNTTRREGLHSTRRPWTPEEEKALMAGLDMVKGPHWSQILSLFGQHGTISDILKDRTQVQLKDKARNLKLFFLKTNSEMPYYLQSVTGELKTRAPGQAARKEAEEKARMNLEEEQARIQGIMTLAGGIQNTHHSVPNTPLAASPSKRTSPATPVFGGSIGGAATNAAHMGTSNGTNLPAMPIPPRIKTELPDQHSLSKVTAFPPIQPAPAHGSNMQQPRTPLPPLQPQPGQHQQPKPHTPQQYQQSQQPRPQDAQKAPMPLPQQQRQPLSQHQSQAQPPSQPQQPQPQTHQQPQQPPAQPTPSTQSQPQQNGLPRPPSAPQQPSLPPQQSPPQMQQQQQQPPRVSPPTTQTHSQPLPTPPIPPNHHSTPDHAQDTRLFETLQAAIAASTASEGQERGQGQGQGQGHVAIATVVSEGGGS